jgi:hypothetical protein
LACAVSFAGLTSDSSHTHPESAAPPAIFPCKQPISLILQSLAIRVDATFSFCMYSTTESSAFVAFRPVGLQKRVKSWQWDVAIAHQHLLNSLREAPVSTFHDLDAMSGGSHSRLLSADGIDPGVNLNAETLPSSRSSRSLSAPMVFIL